MKKIKEMHLAIEGGRRLSGTVTTSSSKNGAVALLAAALLNRGTTTLRRVPKIEEVERIIEVLESIGVSVKRRGGTIIVTPPARYTLSRIHVASAEKTRSSIMLIGPLVHALRAFSLPQSGGCKLGGRTIKPHIFALQKLGVSITTTQDAYKVSRGVLEPSDIVLYESGDTATINTLLAAARIPGTTTIHFASSNYQVQDVCSFLGRCGIAIDGVGTTTLTVHGVKDISADVSHTVGEDPTDAMFFITAAAVTRSSITITRCPIDFLKLELLKLEKMGFRYTASHPYVSENDATKLIDITTRPSLFTALEEKISARPYPGLNIDNLPFFVPIATQSAGKTLIHDWVYEKRAIYYTEFDKLGADTLLADPHRIFITGPTPLRSAELVCPPALRPATILLIGMLAAKGRSVLRNVYSINRGYENLVKRLNALGARVAMFR